MLGEMNELSDETLIISTVIALCAYFTLEDEEDAAAAMEQEIAPTIPRQRRLASDIFEQLGPCYTRRAFRMTAPNFYDLHRYLYPYLRRIYADSPKSHKDGAMGLSSQQVSHTMILCWRVYVRPISYVQHVCERDLSRCMGSCGCCQQMQQTMN